MALIAPLLVVIGLMMTDGCSGGGGSSGTAAAQRPPSNKGYAAVGFDTALAGAGAAAYQRVLLNVVEVRMNPINNATISEYDPHWVTVGVPAATGATLAAGFINTGLGFGGMLFGGTTQALIGQGRAELQIDLNALQNIAQIFNIQSVTSNTYYEFELILDPLVPGNLVPTCSGSAGEGCIAYNAVLDPSIANKIIKGYISGGIEIAKQNISPVVVGLYTNVGPPPFGSTGVITITPQIFQINNQLTQQSLNAGFTNPGPVLTGTITGTVQYPAGKGAFNATARPETVTAEISGTNQIVESVALPVSCNGKDTCPFTLLVPATSGGTAYDVYAAGKVTSFGVASNQIVTAGGTTAAPTLKIESRVTSTFGGKVTDECAAGAAIPAATLQILVPDPAVSGADCATSPVGCVSVATAQTDETGNFPMPGNGFLHAPFNQLPDDKSATYTLSVTAAGFSPFLEPITPQPSKYKCPGTNIKGICNISLGHGTLTGTINVQIPAGAAPTLPQVNVLVMAEDHGTNNIENVQALTIPAGATSNTQVPFTMNVPFNTTTPAAALDVFATAQDVFNGVPQTTTGHTYGVAANVLNGAAKCSDAASVVPNILTIECVGHGSVTGSVTNVGGDTSVVLSKAAPPPTAGATPGYVAVQTSVIAPPPSSTSGSYAICAPPDVYQLTAYSSGVAGTAAPVTVSTPVPISPSPTPCPQVCDSGQGSACLICNGTQGPAVPAP